MTPSVISNDFNQYNFYNAFYNFYRLQGKVMFSQTSVSHSIHKWPHGYSVTAHLCFGAVGTNPTGMLSCSLMYSNHFSIGLSCNESVSLNYAKNG